jgi:hypothetical protein
MSPDEKITEIAQILPIHIKISYRIGAIPVLVGKP